MTSQDTDAILDKLEEGKLVRQTPQTIQTESSYYKKVLSLLVLTPWTAAISLLVRFVRTRPEPMIVPSTAVLVAEVLKTFFSLVIIFFQQGGFQGWLSHLSEHLITRKRDLLICIPSLVFVAQNNINFYALSNLDVATYQVTYQLKILTTALFTVCLLGKRLSYCQWCSLVTLFLGVSAIQAHEALARHSQASSTSSSSTPATVNSSAPHISMPSDLYPQQNYFKGVIAVLFNCVLSGFACVFYEKLLKAGKESVWIKNVQLGLAGIVFAAVLTFSRDGGTLQQQGFFYGYDWVVWVVVMMQSLGGLLVAAVIKYADNILKGFSAGGSILLGCVASVYFFNFQMDWVFMVGTALVVLSVFLYSTYPATQKDQQLEIEVPDLDQLLKGTVPNGDTTDKKPFIHRDRLK